MALWPTVPPAPPGTPTDTAAEIIDVIGELADIPDQAPTHHYAAALTDLQAITNAAYRAFVRTVARVQPGEREGQISLAGLRAQTGASQNAVLGFVRNGRRYEAGTDPTSQEQT